MHRKIFGIIVLLSLIFYLSFSLPFGTLAWLASRFYDFKILKLYLIHFCYTARKYIIKNDELLKLHWKVYLSLMTYNILFTIKSILHKNFKIYYSHKTYKELTAKSNRTLRVWYLINFFNYKCVSIFLLILADEKYTSDPVCKLDKIPITVHTGLITCTFTCKLCLSNKRRINELNACLSQLLANKNYYEYWDSCLKIKRTS